MRTIVKPVLALISTLFIGSSITVGIVYWFIHGTKSNAISGGKKNGARRTGGGRKKGGKCPGLYNLGNTCYANALLQGMASCPSIVHWLESLKNSPGFQQADFLKELLRVVSALNDWESEADSAESIFGCLYKHGWVVPSHVEQDLFELLNVFVSTWDEELGGFLSPKVKSLLQIKDLDHVRHDRFSALSLVIPKNSTLPFVTLESCLKKYFAIEMINNASCENCDRLDRGKSQLIKKQGISKVYGFFKQFDHIQFPEVLDLRDFAFYKSKTEEYSLGCGVRGGRMEQPTSSFAEAIGARSTEDLGLQQNAFISGGSFLLRSYKYKYRLCAMSVHMGTADNGHFITYRRGLGSKARRWFRTSDLSVEEVSFEEVSRSQAYMLYYERFNNYSIAQQI